MIFHLLYIIHPLAAIYCYFSITRKLSALPLFSLSYKQISSKPPVPPKTAAPLGGISPVVVLSHPTNLQPFATKLCLLAEQRFILPECVHLPGMWAQCMVSLSFSPVLVVLHHLVTSSALITVKWVFLLGCKRRAGADVHQPSSCHQVLLATFCKCDLIMKFA